MKIIKANTYVLGIIIILLSSPLISSSPLTLDNNQSKNVKEATFQLGTNQKIIQAIENVTESYLRENLEELVAIGPRKTGAYGCEKAAEHLYQKFEDMGVKVRYQNWGSRKPSKPYKLFRGKNIEAILPGKDDSQDTIVFNAHYDSVKVSPGANDDGSGVVAVLAAANALRNYEFNRTIRFVEFSGEEVGLIGSRAYVEELYENNEDLFFEINADMIGYAETATGGRNVSISPTQDAKWMIDEIQDVNEEYGINFNIKSRWTIPPVQERGGSDYYYFVRYGYESLAFWQDEHNPDYWHTPEDTIEHINFSYLTNMTKLIVASIAHMADIENTHPQVQIGAPRRGRLYFEDRTIRNLRYDKTHVIDDVLVCVEIKPGNAPIEKVEFYYDGKLIKIDTEVPYLWRLNKRSIRRHTIKVIAYDEAGRTARDQFRFFYLNIRTRI